MHDYNSLLKALYAQVMQLREQGVQQVTLPAYPRHVLPAMLKKARRRQIRPKQADYLPGAVDLAEHTASPDPVSTEQKVAHLRQLASAAASSQPIMPKPTTNQYDSVKNAFVKREQLSTAEQKKAGEASTMDSATINTPTIKAGNVVGKAAQASSQHKAMPASSTKQSTEQHPAEGKQSMEPAKGAGQDPTHLNQADSLTALKTDWKNCQKCRLGATRNQFVFGTGHPHPPILFLGEGPGADEDEQGEPFVGQAGRILTGLIKAAGLSRADVYITNMVKCRPPQNRNPAADEIVRCAPLLNQQIALLDPKLIVTLGNVPLKALCPNAEGITKARGQLHQYKKWPVLPTFHPSYLLRNWNTFSPCWEDFRQAVAQIQSLPWLPNRLTAAEPIHENPDPHST